MGVQTELQSPEKAIHTDDEKKMEGKVVQPQKQHILPELRRDIQLDEPLPGPKVPKEALMMFPRRIRSNLNHILTIHQTKTGLAYRCTNIRCDCALKMKFQDIIKQFEEHSKTSNLKSKT